MRKPKALFVSAVSDFKGGAETVIRNMLDNPYIESVLAVPEEGALAEAARSIGVPVVFYLPTALNQVHRPPSVRQIGAAVLDAFRCATRLREAMREHGCDLIHSHGLKPHAMNAILGRFRGVPTVVHMHDIAYTRAERIIWRTIAPCVTRMILVSRPCYPGPRLPNNAVVIPNGIVPIQKVLAPKEDIPTPLRLGFVGRFTRNKGMDLLLDWLKAILAAKLDVVLTLRGRPDPEQPEYWEHIKRRIKEEGLSGVIHHDGWQPRSALYDGLDILLVPSDRPDPGPLVVTEAMSAGVIVIGYPAGGIPLAVKSGETGLLCRDAADIGNALPTLVRDPHAFIHMRQAAHERVLTIFSVEEFHKRIAELYVSILR